MQILFRTATFAFLVLNVLMGVSFAAADKPVGDQIKARVEQWLGQQFKDEMGHTTFQTGAIDPQLHLAPCAHIVIGLANGNRLLGNTMLKASCEGAKPWNIMIPVSIHVEAEYWVSTHALPPNHTMTEGDIELRSGDLATISGSPIRSAKEIIGKITLGGEAPGMPIRAENLRLPWVVKANDIVRVKLIGEGFELTGQGRALGNASTDQRVDIKMNSGAVVHGTAQEDGSVEVLQ